MRSLPVQQGERQLPSVSTLGFVSERERVPPGTKEPSTLWDDLFRLDGTSKSWLVVVPSDKSLGYGRSSQGLAEPKIATTCALVLNTTSLCGRPIHAPPFFSRSVDCALIPAFTQVRRNCKSTTRTPNQLEHGGPWIHFVGNRLNHQFRAWFSRTAFRAQKCFLTHIELLPEKCLQQLIGFFLRRLPCRPWFRDHRHDV
jgi:hypothetical protein